MQEMQATMQIKTADADIAIWGLFMYGDHQAGKESAEAFWADFSRNNADFDCCTGVYRVTITRHDGTNIHFCDNAGCARFYIDEQNAGFYTSLSEAVPRTKRVPNYGAISQFLYYGCIYGLDTPLEGITRSDPEKYYVVKQGKLTARSKNLTPLEEMEVPDNVLEVQMGRLSRAVADLDKVACTITGGTDSRAILAHLLHNGIRPVLDITGHDGQADVEIARKIAETTKLDLIAVSDEPEDERWIDDAIAAADGMTGVCEIYRLHKKAQQLHQSGISLECGGAAGELYKNSFINQDLPLYGGEPRWERFMKYKVGTYDFPQALCGEKISTQMRELPTLTLKRISQHTGKNKANAYLSAGYEIMQARVSGVYGMSTHWYIHYNPLLERNVAAFAFKKNPYKLEMQAFQREQVTSYCPAIKTIETDRGLTCDRNRIIQEFFKSNLFLVKIALQRTFKRGEVSCRIDPCFTQGLSSPQFQTAIMRCKELKIIPMDISNDQIPQGIADRLFALGTLL